MSQFKSKPLEIFDHECNDLSLMHFLKMKLDVFYSAAELV